MTDLKMTDLQFSESSRTGCCSAADNDTAAAGVWNAFRAVPKNGSDRDSRKAFAGAVSADLLKDAGNRGSAAFSGESASGEVFGTLAAAFRVAGTAASAGLAAGMTAGVMTPPLMEKLPERDLGRHPVSNEEAFNTRVCA